MKTYEKNTGLYKKPRGVGVISKAVRSELQAVEVGVLAAESHKLLVRATF